MVDYREYLYSPPGIDTYDAKRTEANLKEQDFFRKTLTTDIAQNTADIFRNYPSMDTRLGIYSGLMGLQADNELTHRLAMLQNEKLMKDNAYNIKEISKGRKASQWGILMLDAGFQPVSRNFKSTMVASEKSGEIGKGQAFLTNLTAGLYGGMAGAFVYGKDGDYYADRLRRTLVGDKFADHYKETKESYGRSEFNRAWDEYRAGRPVNLGRGYLPRSLDLENTEVYRDLLSKGYSEKIALQESEKTYGRNITKEFEEDEYQFQVTTKRAGKVDISPGRIAAGTFFTKEDRSYKIGSAVVDGTFRLTADPINWLLWYGGAAKTGMRGTVTAAERVAWKEKSLIPRLVETLIPGRKGADARRLQFAKTAEEQLKTARGKKFVDMLVKADSIDKLKSIPQWQKVDMRILQLFVDIKNKDEMATTLISLMQNGNLSGLKPLLRIRYGITEDMYPWIAKNAATFQLPIRPNLTGEAAWRLSKLFKEGGYDIAPIRQGLRMPLVAAQKVIPDNLSPAFLDRVVDDVFGGTVGLNAQISHWLPQRVAKYFRLSPEATASVQDIAKSSDNLWMIMKAARLPSETVDKHIRAVLKSADESPSNVELGKVVKDIYKDITRAIIRNNPDLRYIPKEGMTAKEIAKETKKHEKEFFDVVDQVFTTWDDFRKFMSTADETSRPLAFAGTRMKTVTVGPDPYGNEITKLVAVPTPQMQFELMDNYIPLIPYLEVEKSFRIFRKIVPEEGSQVRHWFNDPDLGFIDRYKTILGTTPLVRKTKGAKDWRTGRSSISTGGPGSALDYLYTSLVGNFLKPVWMLRPALALRVAPEEALRLLMSPDIPLSYYHPLHQYGLRFLGGADLIIENNAGQVLWATRIRKRDMDLTIELLGDEFKDAAKMDWEKIGRIMKREKLDVQAHGLNSESFIKYIFDGNDARDFLYDGGEYLGRFGIGKTPTIKVVAKNIQEPTEGYGKTVLKNIEGGTLDTSGNLTDDFFGIGSPYKQYEGILDEEDIYLMIKAMKGMTDEEYLLLREQEAINVNELIKTTSKYNERVQQEIAENMAKTKKEGGVIKSELDVNKVIDEYYAKGEIFSMEDRERAIDYYIKNVYLEREIEEGVKIKDMLLKENHHLGWSQMKGTSSTGKTLREIHFDVSVSLPKLEDGFSAKDVEKVLSNLSILGIKSHQQSMWISSKGADQIRSVLGSRKQVDNWWKYLTKGMEPEGIKPDSFNLEDGLGLGLIDDITEGVMIGSPSEGSVASRIKPYTVDTPHRKEPFELMYDKNFDVARAILKRKRGVGNATPNHYMPMTPEYLNAAATKQMNKMFFGNDNLNNVYMPYNRKSDPMKWRYSLMHQILGISQDPITTHMLVHGIDDTVEFLLNTPQGRLYLDDLVGRQAKDNIERAKEELFDPKYLRENLESRQYRIARLLGASDETAYIKHPFTGELMQEEEAVEIIVKDGKNFYPQYFSDLSDSNISQKGLELLESQGRLNNKDWREEFKLITQTGPKVWSRNIKKPKKRIQDFYDRFWNSIKEDELLFPEWLNGSHSFLDDVLDMDDPQILAALEKRHRDNLAVLYETFLTKPSDILNRDPIWRFMTFEHAAVGLKFLDEDTAVKFVRGSYDVLAPNASGNKVGKTLHENLNKTLKELQKNNGFLGEVTDIKTFEAQLLAKSQKTVIDLLYSTSERHVFSDILSSYVPFPEIGFEVPKSWGGIIAKNPSGINRARMLMDAGEERGPGDNTDGWFFNDPVSGKKMFAYPDVFNIFTKTVFGEDTEAQGIRVKPAGFLSGLNLVASNGFLPSLGPIVTSTMAFFRRNLGPLPQMFEEILYGTFPPPKGMEEFIPEPSYLKKFRTAKIFKEGESDDYLDRAYAATVIDTLAVMYAKGLIDPSDPVEAERMLEQLQNAANQQWILRGLAQATLPTGIQPRIEVQDKTGKWWFVQSLVKEYQRMLKVNNFDYMQTQEQFTDRFGINPIPLTMSKAKPRQKLPTRESAVRYWLKPDNNKLLREYPNTAYWIHPDNLDDPWDWTNDWDDLKEYYSESEWQDLTRQTLLEIEYSVYKQDLIEQANANPNDSKTMTWMRGQAAQKLVELEESYKIDAFHSLGYGEEKQSYGSKILELKRWADDPRLSRTPEWGVTRQYLNKRDEAIAFLNGEVRTYTDMNGGFHSLTKKPQYKTRPLESTSEVSAFIRDDLLAYAQELIKENPDTNFSGLFYYILYYEVNNLRER